MPLFSSSPSLELLLLIPILFVVSILIFQWLWNITIPGIFKLREISFWEAFRLLLISAFLFGGLRFKSGG